MSPLADGLLDHNLLSLPLLATHLGQAICRTPRELCVAAVAACGMLLQGRCAASTERALSGRLRGDARRRVAAAVAVAERSGAGARRRRCTAVAHVGGSGSAWMERRGLWKTRGGGVSGRWRAGERMCETAATARASGGGLSREKTGETEKEKRTTARARHIYDKWAPRFSLTPVKPMLRFRTPIDCIVQFTRDSSRNSSERRLVRRYAF